MEAGVPTHIGPRNNDWFGFNPDFHKIIWFDEYKGHLTIQDLSGLCDKYTSLNVKGSSIAKTRKLLVVVTSNYDINGCYHAALEKDPSCVDPLLARFKQIKLNRA